MAFNTSSQTSRPTASSINHALAAQFPQDLIRLLRCTLDGGSLLIEAEPRTGEIGIIDANLQCTACAAQYRIRDGIARMLPVQLQLSPEDAHEIAIRDGEYTCTQAAPFLAPATGWRSEFNDLVEIPPFLKELEPLENCTVLELGCGDGRFTMLMAQMGARVMAIDFSLNALRRMAGWLASGVAPTAFRTVRRRSDHDLRPYIGLVHADAGRFCVGPESFDRALSATPLDSRDQRMAMYRSIADALRDGGRYIGSFEHDDLARRLLGLPRARRYRTGGIYIEHLEPALVHYESAPYFSKRRVIPIRPKVPFLVRLPQTLAAGVVTVISRLPILRNLGEILLLRAEGPVRPPVEGTNRRGNPLVKGAFRWYTRRLGKEAVWGEHEPV
jgi:SAM-dependent methyltransferase